MTASAGISYLLDGTRYSADLIAGSGLRTTSDNENTNEGTVPSYEQVNLGISHRFAQGLGGPVYYLRIQRSIRQALQAAPGIAWSRRSPG